MGWCDWKQHGEVSSRARRRRLRCFFMLYLMHLFRGRRRSTCGCGLLVDYDQSVAANAFVSLPTRMDGRLLVASPLVLTIYNQFIDQLLACWFRYCLGTSWTHPSPFLPVVRLFICFIMIGRTFRRIRTRVIYAFSVETAISPIWPLGKWR